MQAVLPRHLRPLRDKIFGPAPSHRLDPNAKARLWVAANAYNSANRVGRRMPSRRHPASSAGQKLLRFLDDLDR